MALSVQTYVLVRRADEILLGYKKRGFGAGQWNGYGGKVKDGEPIKLAAEREFLEETGVQVTDLDQRAILMFHIKDRDSIEMHVFFGTQLTAEPKETEEMRPSWFNVKKIPYASMWPDDEYWLPLLLEDKHFTGTFWFSAEAKIIKHELSVR